MLVQLDGFPSGKKNANSRSAIFFSPKQDAVITTGVFEGTSATFEFVLEDDWWVTGEKPEP